MGAVPGQFTSWLKGYLIDLSIKIILNSALFSNVVSVLYDLPEMSH